MRDRRAGFTLIELIVVMTIISILASISVVNYRKALLHAEAARLSMNLHQMEEVVEMSYLAGDLDTPTGFAALDFDGIVRILRQKRPDDATVVDFPRPDGLDITFFAGGGRTNLTPGQAAGAGTIGHGARGQPVGGSQATGGGGAASNQARGHRSVIVTLTDSTPDNRHADLLDMLASIRPLTMREGGHTFVMEILDLEGDGV